MSKRDANAGTPCLICGYDLTGLPEEGSCPECGAPAAGSLHGDILRYSSLLHRRRLVAGGAVLLIVALVDLPVSLVRALWFAVAAFDGKPHTALVVFGNVWVDGVVVASVVGWWLLTDSEPAWREHDRLDSLRRAIRVLLLLMTATLLVGSADAIWITILSAVNPTGSSTGQWEAILIPLVGVAGLMMVITFFVAAVFLRRFCRRIDRADVLRQARRLIWLVPLVLGGLAVIDTLVTALSAYGAIVHRTWMFASPVLFAATTVLIWIRFLSGLHRRLRELRGDAAVSEHDAGPTLSSQSGQVETESSTS